MTIIHRDLKSQLNCMPDQWNLITPPIEFVAMQPVTLFFYSCWSSSAGVGKLPPVYRAITQKTAHSDCSSVECDSANVANSAPMTAHRVTLATDPLTTFCSAKVLVDPTKLKLEGGKHAEGFTAAAQQPTLSEIPDVTQQPNPKELLKTTAEPSGQISAAFEELPFKVRPLSLHDEAPLFQRPSR